MFVCWSVKGGSGTTVVAAALALLRAESGSTVLVDTGGDLPATLGIAEPHGPGVTEWMASPAADADALHRLAVPVRDRLCLLPRGAGELDVRRWHSLVEALVTDGDDVVIDAGTRVPPDRLDHRVVSLLVIRACYLSLRRVAMLGVRPDGVILLTEPGRLLGPKEVEHAAGAPVVAHVPWDPAVARAVDSGLLAAKVPGSLQQPLRRAA
jgi:hypothetical protein